MMLRRKTCRLFPNYKEQEIKTKCQKITQLTINQKTNGCCQGSVDYQMTFFAFFSMTIHPNLPYFPKVRRIIQVWGTTYKSENQKKHLKIIIINNTGYKLQLWTKA